MKSEGVFDDMLIAEKPFILCRHAPYPNTARHRAAKNKSANHISNTANNVTLYHVVIEITNLISPFPLRVCKDEQHYCSVLWSKDFANSTEGQKKKYSPV